MEYSDLFMKKIMTDVFGPVLKQNWLKSTMQWMINSKYRTYKKLTSHLEDQITNPHPLMVTIADNYARIYKDEDMRIVKIQNYVQETIAYTRDQTQFGYPEHWATASQVYQSGKDDCDGGNALIYVLARLSGIQPTKLWCAIGDVNGGGHFWCMYYSTNLMKLTPIDFCYYTDKRSMHMRREYSKDLYKNIWYIFNDKICFKGD